MSRRLSRDAVIAHGADLADEIRLHEVTITKLARELGITAPGVYRHVRDLPDLRGGISQLAAEGLAAELSSTCAGLAGMDALTALATTFRAWAAAHPGRHNALQTAPDADDEPGQVAANTLLDVMAAALRAYELSGDDLVDGVRLLRSTLHGFAALEAEGGFKQSRSPDATFQRTIGALDVVLRGWAAS